MTKNSKLQTKYKNLKYSILTKKTKLQNYLQQEIQLLYVQQRQKMECDQNNDDIHTWS